MCATHAPLVARVVDRPLAIQFFVSNPRTSMWEDLLFIDFMKIPNALGTTGRKAIITDYVWLPLDFAWGPHLLIEIMSTKIFRKKSRRKNVHCSLLSP